MSNKKEYYKSPLFIRVFIISLLLSCFHIYEVVTDESLFEPAEVAQETSADLPLMSDFNSEQLPAHLFMVEWGNANILDTVPSSWESLQSAFGEDQIAPPSEPLSVFHLQNFRLPGASGDFQQNSSIRATGLRDMDVTEQPVH